MGGAGVERVSGKGKGEKGGAQENRGMRGECTASTHAFRTARSSHRSPASTARIVLTSPFNATTCPSAGVIHARASGVRARLSMPQAGMGSVVARLGRGHATEAVLAVTKQELRGGSRAAPAKEPTDRHGRLRSINVDWREEDGAGHHLERL
eukprot:1376252-Rhodomonas_salina.2